MRCEQVKIKWGVCRVRVRVKGMMWSTCGASKRVRVGVRFSVGVTMRQPSSVIIQGTSLAMVFPLTNEI